MLPGRAKIFFYCNLCFVFGIGLASFVLEKILHNTLVWFITAVILFLVAVFCWPRFNSRLFFLLGAFLFLGIWRYSLELPFCKQDDICRYNGEVVSLEAEVAKEPDIRLRSQKLTLSNLKRVSVGGEKRNQFIRGSILLTIDLYPEFFCGDRIFMECRLEEPKPFESFSYDRYLSRYGINSLCYFPKKIEKLGSIENNMANSFGRKFKEGLRKTINFGLSEPEAGIARAMFLGDMQSIDSDLKDAFSRSGLTHVIAISGTHISLLAALVLSILLRLGFDRRKAFYLCTFTVVSYVLMVGMPASAVRAGIMGLLALIAIHMGRLNKFQYALVFAGALMLAVNPKLLRDDIGFQLSFLALLGLIYVYPLFLKSSERINCEKTKLVADVFFMTIAAQLTTWPVIAYNFGQISVIAPIANLFAIWIFPPLMAVFFCAMALSFFLPMLSVLFFLPSLLILKYLILTAKYCALPKFSFISIDYIPPVWILIFYLILGIFVVYWQKRSA